MAISLLCPLTLQLKSRSLAGSSSGIHPNYIQKYICFRLTLERIELPTQLWTVRELVGVERLKGRTIDLWKVVGALRDAVWVPLKFLNLSRVKNLPVNIFSFFQLDLA